MLVVSLWPARPAVADSGPEAAAVVAPAGAEAIDRALNGAADATGERPWHQADVAADGKQVLLTFCADAPPGCGKASLIADADALRLQWIEPAAPGVAVAATRLLSVLRPAQIWQQPPPRAPQGQGSPSGEPGENGGVQVERATAAISSRAHAETEAADRRHRAWALGLLLAAAAVGVWAWRRGEGAWTSANVGRWTALATAGVYAIVAIAAHHAGPFYVFDMYAFAAPSNTSRLSLVAQDGHLFDPRKVTAIRCGGDASTVAEVQAALAVATKGCVEVSSIAARDDEVWDLLESQRLQGAGEAMELQRRVFRWQDGHIVGSTCASVPCVVLRGDEAGR